MKKLIGNLLYRTRLNKSLNENADNNCMILPPLIDAFMRHFRSKAKQRDMNMKPHAEREASLCSEGSDISQLSTKNVEGPRKRADYSSGCEDDPNGEAVVYGEDVACFNKTWKLY